VKLRTSNFVRTFIGSSGIKAHEKFWQSSRGRSQGVPKILVASCGRLAISFEISYIDVVVEWMYELRQLPLCPPQTCNHHYRAMHFSANARSWDRICRPSVTLDEL